MLPNDELLQFGCATTLGVDVYPVLNNTDQPLVPVVPPKSLIGPYGAWTVTEHPGLLGSDMVIVPPCHTHMLIIGPCCTVETLNEY